MTANRFRYISTVTGNITKADGMLFLWCCLKVVFYTGGFAILKDTVFLMTRLSKLAQASSLVSRANTSSTKGGYDMPVRPALI